LGYPPDQNHPAAKPFAAQVEAGLLIPEVVLVAAIDNLRRLGGTPAAVRFASLLMSQSPQLTPLTLPDVERAIDVMRTYGNADLDFVDGCLTALAQRLDVTQICIFDRRVF
jgi:predicted nucleic acid-binding protein